MKLPSPFSTIYLLTTILLVFIFHNIPGMSKFSWPIITLLTFFSLFHNLYYRQKPLNYSVINNLNISNSLIITIITLLLLLESGGLSSPLFLLLNFLLFSLTLLLNSLAGITASLALVTLFLLNQPLTSHHQLINLISLLLTPPIARIFSTHYLHLLNNKKEIKILKQQPNLFKSDLKQKDTSTLIYLSQDFYNKLHQSLDILSQISSSLASTPYHQREKIKQLYQDLKELFKSGEQLERKIDKLINEN